MSQRIPLLFSIGAAPFLFIDFMVNEPDTHPVSMGIFGFIYMAGWMTSIVRLWQAGAVGNERSGRAILLVQLLFLCIAQVWNLMVVMQVHNASTLFMVTDLFWPLSNLFMIVTGIAVLGSGTLPGWRKYIPLAVGLWLPLSLLLLVTMGRVLTVNLLSGGYSAIAWTLLALAIPSRKTATGTFQSTQSVLS